ncbi:amidohydrolase family protein [Lacticaseibacillus zhaodongensis]|uniref:amidohydrolase family protein n=1 Tax=Lacticaseibacillus zhaodongensis TaxID=2668065 RepID=UPI0012D2ABD6|nr:amidohydrolase family protein [Lacticaseibacillus zhaodongensis]
MHKIDFHTHYIAPTYRQYLADKFNGRGDGVATPDWDIETHRAMMQDLDIIKSIISVSSPHTSVGTDTTEANQQLVQSINQYAFECVQKYPDEFGFMASLPLPDAQASAQAVKDIRRDFNPTGFTLPTNANGVYIGDKSLDPVMAALDADHAIVSIHPNEPQKQDIKANEHVKTPLVEFFFDTTRTLVNMAQASIFSRYPNITWIIPHAGALLPVIAQRVEAGSKFLADGGEPATDSLLAAMPHLYYDMAGMVLPYQLPQLLQIVNPDHFLYGADYPYTPEPVIQKLADQLETTDVLTVDQKEAMFHGNAEKLLAK